MTEALSRKIGSRITSQRYMSLEVEEQSLEEETGAGR
jgi:hypothetical protein